jgi:energy-coupling factor transporter ATP-binding protein EcfA2
MNHKPEPFDDLGPTWSEPRPVRAVLRELALATSERLSKQQLAALVDALAEHGVDAATIDGEAVGRDGPSPGARGLLRLRRRRGAVLSEATFGNFKSFAAARLPLAELTVLIGRNGSGKSNAIEALKLLAFMAEGRRLSNILGAVERGELGLRGTPTDLFLDRGSPLQLGCVLQDDRLGQLELAVSLALDGDSLRVVDERLESPSESHPLYRVADPASNHGREMQVEYNTFSRGRRPRIPCVDEQPVFTQLTTPARFSAGHDRAQRDIPSACRLLEETLSNILFLDPTPSAMRGYSFETDVKLRGDGANVSGVLHHLVERGLGPEILDFVRALPESNIEGLTFLAGARRDVMVSLTESFGGVRKPREAVLLSDGTLRVLAIAAASYSVRSGSVVVIEEIDNGIHPSRVRDLLGRLQSVARERRLRLLITTHNPALLDALPPEALPHVVACFRDSTSGASHLVRLTDLHNYPMIAARGPLGRLTARGELEGFLRDGRAEPSPSHEWLDELFGKDD